MEASGTCLSCKATTIENLRAHQADLERLVYESARPDRGMPQYPLVFMVNNPFETSHKD